MAATAGAGGAPAGGTGGAPPQSGGASALGGSASGSSGAGAVAGGGPTVGGWGSSGAPSGGSGGSGGAATLNALTVYVVGDSTVQTYTNSPIRQAGWGQFLQKYFDPRAKVENRAIGGRTARRFIDEGRLDSLLAAIKPGDYLLIQFGTNDANPTATYALNGQTIPYYLNPATDFKVWITRYITGARDRSANPVLVTPPPRRSCTGDSHDFGNGLAAYATSMKEMGAAQNVPVVDLNKATLDHLNQIGCVAAGRDFFLVRADGTVDGTHFQEKGADIMAGFVALGVRTSNTALSSYVP